MHLFSSYKIYKAHRFKQDRVRGAGVARWGTWLARKGKRWVLRLCLKEPMDGNSLIFCRIDFQTVGAANWKLLRPMALVVKGMCWRLSEENRRCLGELLKLTRTQMHRRWKAMQYRQKTYLNDSPYAIQKLSNFCNCCYRVRQKRRRIAAKIAKNTRF